MNFNDFAHQMILKYRVTLAVAILKSKPENLSTHKYIEVLKAKIEESEMEYDSDVTICSDDFLMDDEDVEVTKVNGEDEEANLSANILEGFDLEEFVQENDGEEDLDAQMSDLFEERPPDKEMEEVSKNIPTQSTFCESTQSQSHINEFELMQNSLTYFETEKTKDQPDPTSDNIATHKQITINNNTKNINNPSTSSQHTLTYEDSQKTQLYNIYSLSQEFTHVSESQSDYWKVKANHLHNKSTYAVVSKENGAVNNPKICEQPDKLDNVDTTEKVLSETQEIDDANKNNISQLSNGEINSYINLNTLQNTVFYDLIKTKPNNIAEINPEDINEVSAKFHCTEPVPTFHNANSKNNFDTNDTYDNNDFYDQNQYELDKEDDNIIQGDSQDELIPFKVIEELNRVKSYLNRRDVNRLPMDGNGTDSGYKSDSLRSNFNRTSQSSDSWINQSAHCLLKFLVGCPIVVKTRDISVEISWTLGRLIDKLHDEEKYPSFLEEVLETVEKLLQHINEGDSYVEDVILRKDVDIHKLFHLNRSQHIIKYTIDKITQLLESFLARITEDSSLEMTDTVQMENLCYIFNILGYLIKRLAVTRDNSSQNSTQTTQDDDRSLKRSSLTDVWRKKWNPKYKSESQQSNPHTKCPKTKCSEILNKIIVKSMDGYSLISFAALQCYNILQS